MNNYFILNLETGKLELHFEKETYMALTDDQKSRIKSSFLWGRNSKCWISRAKEPNLYAARKVAEDLGLTNAGREGERLSFAEQMDRKAERAERRAERYEDHAEAAERRAEALQKPIRDMHGDIAFFTQPNINTSAGRAFTRRRERMFASFERGFEEFRKSEYWTERAANARATAAQKELQDKAYLTRRIEERAKTIRKLKSNIEEYEGYLQQIDAGETPHNKTGWTINMSAEQIAEQIDYYLERMEIRLDELGFYQECLEKLGGVTFSRENIKPGYIVKVRRLGGSTGVVLSTGPKNCTIKCGSFPLKYSYSEILEVVKEAEEKPQAHPYKVGDTFSCDVWDHAAGKCEKKEFTIIRSTDKSITLQTGTEKPFIRKPAKSQWTEGDWYVNVTDSYNGCWRKRA